MIVRNSQRVPPCSAREPRSDAISVASDRGELYDGIACHGSVASQPRDELFHNLTDQPGTVVLIGIARHGLGTIVRPFKHFSFHNSEIARG